MTIAGGSLSGKRVLVVEDEVMVAMLIEDMLTDEGCSVIGPFGTLAAALKAAQTQPFDLGLLDINLAGEEVYPVAEELTSRHIPFVFLSGYGETAIPKSRPKWKVCEKPFRVSELIDMLSDALTATRN